MKKGDARRDELLTTAERMFCMRGYEQTSVQDILDEMHFSKGGFYHHFDSKLSVLEAICDQRAQETCEAAQQGMEKQTQAIDKLNALFCASALWNSSSPGFMTLLIQVAYRQDGALMREKMKACQIERMQPMVEKVLAQGVNEKIFFVADVPRCAALLLRMYIQFTDEIAFLLAREESEDHLNEEMVRTLCVYRIAIERMLGAPFGSIVLFDIRELQQLGQQILRGRISRRAQEKLSE